MNKKFLVFLLLLTPFFLHAFDFGFGINNRTILKHNAAVKTDETEGTKATTAEEKALFSLWMNHYFDENLYFQVTGHAQLGTDYFDVAKDYAFLASGDIDAFYVGGKYKLEESPLTYVDFKIGRQFFTDFTNEVAVTVLDGFNVGFGNTKAQYRFTAGYTGLLYNWSNTILMGINDLNASQTWSKGYKDLDAEQAKSMDNYSALHGSPRLIGNFEVNVPEVFKGQKLTFNLLGQMDMWPYVSNADFVKEGDTVKNTKYGSTINTVYAGLGLKGAIISELYYNVFGYFGTGAYLDLANETRSYQSKAFTSGLLGLDLTGYIKEGLSSKITFSARYASGDSNRSNKNYFDLTTDGKTNTQFLPLNQQQLNTVFNPIMSNLATFSLAYTFKPFSTLGNPYLEDFILGASVKSFLRGSKSAISEQEVKIESDSAYLGTELDFKVTLINLSDFNMGLSTGVFFPNAEAFIANNDKPKLESELNFTINL